MARDEKDRVGTPGEYALRDDDRSTSTSYGRPRRRTRSLAFMMVVLLVGFGILGLIFARRGEAPTGTRGGISGEAVLPAR